jgi:hypothetical protein
VTYDDKYVVDEWVTGPYYPAEPRTGWHKFYVPPPSDSAPVYYQFKVYASTHDHHHCTYYSNKFTVYGDYSSTLTSTSTDYTPVHHAHHASSSSSSSSYYPDDPESSTSYEEGYTTTTTDYESTAATEAYNVPTPSDLAQYFGGEQ